MPTVEVEEKTIRIIDLTIVDEEACEIVLACPEEQRDPLVKRALKIGLIMCRDAGTIAKADFVRLEFSKLKQDIETYWKDEVQSKIDATLKVFFDVDKGTFPQILKSYMGEDGKLSKFFDENDTRSFPHQLKQYLGDKGKLPQLFDEKNTESVTYKLKQMLSDNLTGENSIFIQKLDPGDPQTPIGKLASRIEGKIGNIETLIKGEEAVSEIKEQTPLKGGEYEDQLYPVLERIAKPFGDVLSDVHSENKPGDFVVTLDKNTIVGKEIRLAIDAKDRNHSLPECERVLDGSKKTWNAQAAMIVFAGARFVPTEQVNPLGPLANGFVCVYDKNTQDDTFLAAAYRLSRLEAVREVRRQVGVVEPAAIQEKLDQAAAKLRELSTLKRNITDAKNAVGNLWQFVDRIQGEIFDLLDQARLALGSSKPLPAISEEPTTTS